MVSSKHFFETVKFKKDLKNANIEYQTLSLNNSVLHTSFSVGQNSSHKSLRDHMHALNELLHSLTLTIQFRILSNTTVKNARA